MEIKLPGTGGDYSGIILGKDTLYFRSPAISHHKTSFRGGRRAIIVSETVKATVTKNSVEQLKTLMLLLLSHRLFYPLSIGCGPEFKMLIKLRRIEHIITIILIHHFRHLFHKRNE